MNRPEQQSGGQVARIARALERYTPIPEAGCWIYDGCANAKGYGHVSISKNRGMGAHRFFYTHLVGPIPPGLCVLHKCDTPPCVNPDHLFIGTIADNNADRARKGRCDGEWNGRSRLTREQVREIRTSKLDCTKLARSYGVAPRTVRDARAGTTWRSA